MKNENTKSKTVIKTSIFPASKNRIFDLLQGFDILREIASPYMLFNPIDNDENLIWKEGSTFKFSCKLFGFIPFGTHTIKVIEFNQNRIYTNESHSIVPIWNHEIILKEMGNKTEYSDIVEIYAGWMTIFIYIWANLFYAHRQRKWIRILNKED